MCCRDSVPGKPSTPIADTEQQRRRLGTFLEIEEKRRLRREEVAARLHALADALASNNEVEFERGGLRFTVHVPDEVNFKLEIEIEIGAEEREIEIELSW